MNKIKKIYLLLIVWLIALSAFSQTYPIQVNVYALPPYSNQLSDYYSTSKEKLVVVLLNRDQQRPTIDVELQMTITTASGLKIQSKQGVYFPTITLTQGVLTRLTQDDLAPYLQPQNITQQGYMNQGKLPDGLVEFTFQVIEKYTRKQLSLPATARVWLVAQKPPLLSLPGNGEFVAFRDPLNLKFQWTPQHKNLAQVEYEFELRELPNNGAAPQSAFLYSPVIYQEKLLFTNLMYTPMLPPLDPDKTYGWRIRAIAKDGVDEVNLFENNGYSEIWFFKTQINCLSPLNCSAVVKDRNINLSWAGAAGNSEYVVQYRSKTATSGEWQTLNTKETAATLKALQRSTTYEYRVGGICAQGGQPVYSGISEASIGARDLGKCGVVPAIDLSNQEMLPELRVGEEVIVGGDFPMTVTKVSGSNGNFAGEGWIPVNWVFESKLAVEFDNLIVNTDRQQVGGIIRAKYDKTNSQIADLDAFDHGGVVDNTRNGIIMPDLSLDFTIPENPVFTYDESADELLVYTTDGQSAGKVEMPKNDGKVVFPFIVKDKDGNLYKIEEPADDSTEPGSSATPSVDDGNKRLTATYLGKQGEALPKLDDNNIAYNTAIVTFEQGDGKYAFDQWQDYYKSVSIIENKNVYDHLNSGTEKPYDVPWKFMPVGETDVVTAKIKIVTTDSKFDPEKVIFSTPQGTTFKSAYNKKDKAYAITLVAGQNNDVQEIYALNKLSNDKYETLGKLDVVSYDRQTPKVVVVSVNNYAINTDDLKKELDKIYNPVGVTWEVSADKFTYHTDKDFFDKSSGLLTAYNSKMDSLQTAYKKAIGSKYQKDACYIFVLNYSGVEKNRNTAGFMPRGKQFGYIFLSNLDKKEINNVVAHELGHGLWKLRHTFDDSYGKTAQATEGSTNNLMDYHNSTALAKWQWDEMSVPAIFDGVFDGDEEAMQVKNNSIVIAQPITCLAPNNKKIRLPANTEIMYCCDSKDKEQGYLYKFRINNKTYKAKSFISFQTNDYVFDGYYFGKEKYAASWEGEVMNGDEICLVNQIKIELEDIFSVTKVKIKNTTKKELETINEIGRIKIFQNYCASDTKRKQQVLDNLLTLNKDARSTQAIELTSWDPIDNILKYYRLTNNQLEEIEDWISDNDIKNGKWTDKSIETLTRYTVNNDGIIQIQAFGFQKDLKIFAGKNADLPTLSNHIKEQTNKFLLEYNVDNFEKKAPIFKNDNEIFADGKKIEIGGNNSTFFKIIQEGVGLTTTLLKTGEIEDKVYLTKTEASSIIHGPGLVTGSFEVIAQKVTDVTSLGCTVYNIVVDKETRKEIYSQFVEIKNQIGDDYSTFVPVLVDVVITVTSGNNIEQWKTILDENADTGERTHLVTRGTGNTVITVMSGAALVKDLPEIGERLAENIRKVKKTFRFSQQQINEYVNFATKNSSSEKVMLGKYLDGGEASYIKRAGKEYTYFDLGKEKWAEAEKFVYNNPDEMWRINKQFIDEQKALNKDFYFSYEPWIVESHEFLSREAEYLIDLGAKDFIKINENTWKVIW